MADGHPAKGTLYLIATPLGNLEDVSGRALRLLKEADLIACEDTRHTARLLSHFGIRTACLSLHEHNESRRSQHILALLEEGKKVALVSDAGTPLLSDPGYVLVAACRAAAVNVVPVPGPSAAIAALTASGLPTDRFFFCGFLPHKKGARRNDLEEVAAIPATLLFFEAPHRLLETLADMIEILGDRKASLARELTKIHEEFVCGSLSEILTAMRSRTRIRGEITLVVDRNTPARPTAAAESAPSITTEVEQEMQKTGASKKEALKSVARRRGLSRRDAYRQILDEK